MWLNNSPIFTCVLILLHTFGAINGSNLSVEEVRARIARIPPKLKNVLTRMTNEVEPQLTTVIGNNTRIIGGVQTSIEEYPHQIAILYLNSQVCGGSVISDSWIVTAAHCLDWQPLTSQITIRYGSSLRNTGGSIHATFYYHLHESYDPLDYPYDVATLRVKTPFSGPANSIIPLTTSEWTAGEVTVTGWGWDENQRQPDVLHKVTLPVVDRITCNVKWEGTVTDDMICAGGQGIDSCNGDSGGPAIQNGVLFGVVSWGADICGNGLPGVYTNIAHTSIRNFIKRTTMV
ncbi:trypsin delta-like [Uranotaenia lowii]|uniref:trypsin delta-like n=1 Tax=Uranotaenia lowii TaxID=190385 RepID=UPI0024789E62|nr:trypsin delta-like [Uranotaenia lowii]